MTICKHSVVPAELGSAWKIVVSFSLLLLSALSIIHAENSSRECIRWVETDSLGRFQLVIIPAGAAYVPVGTMQFHLASSSDAVVNVAIMVPDSQSPARGKMEAHLIIDNGHNYRVGAVTVYPLRIGRQTYSTLHFRVFFDNIPAGDHEFNLKISNPESQNIGISGYWITPLFVDAGNTIVWDQFIWQGRSIGSTWTTIGTVTMPSVTNRHLYLSSYIYGYATGDMEFRYVAGGVTLASFRKNWGNADDGGVFNFLWKNPTAGAQVQLQAKGPGIVDWMEHYGQTLQKFTVIDASFEGNRNVPTTAQTQEFLRSGKVQLNSLTMQVPAAAPNQWQTCGWGYASVEMTQSASREDLLSLRLLENGTPFPFDIGQVEHSPNPVRGIYRGLSDWGCGMGLFGPPNSYEVSFNNWATCGGTTLTAHRGRFGIIITPTPGSHACISSNPGAGSCPYSCWIDPNLTRVLAPARNFCN